MMTFSAAEGQTTPNNQLPFKVKLSNESDEIITVTYETVDGTGATGAVSTGAAKDFTAQAATVLTFNPGEITKTVNVELIADTVDEPAETFGLRLSLPTNASFAGTAVTTLDATGTIVPDELPAVNLTSAEAVTGINEGDTATTDYKFTVKLAQATTADTVFKYRTVAGTGATGAIADTDFIGVTNGTVTVLSGTDTATITVKVKGDTRFEVDKTFGVEIFDINTAIYSAGILQATGIIKNDDLRPTISFESPTFSAAEGQTLPNNQLPFKIKLSNESDEAITVTYETVDGTGVNGAVSTGATKDFTAQAATVLTFAPGETSKTVNVEMIADTVDEPAETFALRLSLPTNATFAGTATTLDATGTIAPDEQPYTFSVIADNPTVVEGNTGTKIVKFTVTLDRDPQEDLTLGYSTFDGTASAGTDFVNNEGTLTFAKNSSRTQTIDVVINSNTVFEPNRDFSLRIFDPTLNRAIVDPAKQSATTLIQDDDLPTLSFKVGNTGDVRRVEGATGTTTTAEVVVELSEISTQDVTVEFTTLDGTGVNAATIADSDYQARTTAGQKITIRRGQKSATASFTIVGDNKIEQDETFLVKLSNPIGATLLGSDTQAVIIEDDDGLIASQPKVSIVAVNANQDEGAAGTTKTYTFSVTLDKAPEAGKPVTVNVSTVNGTGATGATSTDNDFVAKNQIFTFNPGDALTQTFTVQVNGDAQVESTETFTVALGVPTNATLLTSSATATIRDDDTPVGLKPVISISPATLTQLEGNTGTKAYTFTIQLDRLPVVGENVTVDVATVDGIGANGAISTGASADFTAKTQSFTFTSTGALTQDFTVLVNGDSQIEPDETFTVELRNTIGATLTRNSATATISDDDTPIVTLPRISVTPLTQSEGNSGTTPFTFRIQLDKAPDAGQTVSVEVATIDGAGSSGAISTGSNADFIAKTQTFTFTSTGALTQDFTVLINGDNQIEQTETFTIALRNVTGAILSTNQALGTITNDDSLNSGGTNNISVDSLNDILWRNPTTGETLLWQTNLGPTTRADIIPNNYDPSTWRYGGTADFNKDGNTDVLWHNIQTGEVIIWKTNGNAIEAFIIPTINPLGTSFSVPGEWHIEDISDYTGDNKPDIFWRNYQTNQTLVWEMNGFDYASGKYFSQPISLDWKIESIADFTGSGTKSVFWRNQKTGDTLLWQLVSGQTTNGGWGGIAINLRVDQSWKVVASGDMNGDRTSDVLWQNTVSGEAIVWYMGRTGLLRGDVLPKPTNGFTITGAADFNLDGVTDLLLQNPLTRENKIWYLQQTATGVAYGSSALLPTSASNSQFLGISKASGSTVPQLNWRNPSNRDFITWQISSSPNNTSTPYSALSDPDIQIIWTGDLENTGKAKVLTRNQRSGIIEIGDLTNGLYTKTSNLLPLDQNWVYRGIGDVDADGVKDIFWQNLVTGKVEIWKVGGSTYAKVLAPQIIPGADWVINQVADLDADGQVDIFWRNTTTQQTAIWLMSGQNIKDSGSLGVLPFEWQIVKVADFDRNGTADFLLRNSQTGEVVTFLMDGKSIKTGNSLTTLKDPAWVIKNVADFDRDGNPDILWYNSQTKQTAFWQLRDGKLKSGVVLPNVPSSSWDLVGTRDFNADGSLDLLWLDRATGTPTIWYLNGMTYGAKVTLPDLPNPNFQVVGLDDFNQVPV
jgi:Calx-beta domain/FG-GAP-like repeat